MLEIKGVYFKFEEEFILENISVVIDHLDFIAIIGPNGGGKTTLLKLILGIHKLQKGEITIYGKPIKKGTIGYVPQTIYHNLNFPIKVLDVVLMGAFHHHITPEDRVRGLELLETMGIATLANKPMAQLSGGQRQRVLIARALFNTPDILLLDEPTSSIDIKGQEQIYKTLEHFNKQMTIVVISHDITHIVKYANKVLYLNRTSTHHQLFDLGQKEGIKQDDHICEIELFEMLQKAK